MRVLMLTGGSHGDVHPFLAIGRALRARGHEVRLLVHPYFRADVEAAGLEHAPVGESVDLAGLLRDPRLMHPVRGGPLVVGHILEHLGESVARLREHLTSFRPAALVSHHICFGAPWAAREAGVPDVRVLLAPMLWFHRDDPVPAPQRAPGRVRRAIARRMLPVFRVIAPWFVDRRFAREKRALGLAADPGGLVESFRGGDANLGMWSPTLRPRFEGDPEHAVVCGFPWYDRADLGPTLDASLGRFLDAGDPPVVFSLGTAAVHTARDFYALATAACGLAGLRGVLLHGGVAGVPDPLPDTMHAAAYAPFSLLMPRAAVNVHHGGIGSTAQAMRAGRPMVVVPHAHDQFNNATHAVLRGVGLQIRRDRLRAPRLAELLRRAADDGPLRANAIALGAAIRAEEDGAVVAAREIERAARREPPREGPARATT